MLPKRFRFIFPHSFYLRRKRRKRYCFLFILSVVLLVASFTTWVTYKEYYGCSNAEVEDAVNVICDLYLKNEAVGNICHDLCVASELKPEGCLHHHLGKDVVFAASWNDEKVIMKTTKLYPSQFEPVFLIDDEGNFVYPSWEEFSEMVKNTISVHLNVTLTGHAWIKTNGLRKMWSPNLLDPYMEKSKKIKDAVMISIWNLLQQTEYMLIKYFEDYQVFPKVLGTCGHMYAVQFVEPLHNMYWGIRQGQSFALRTLWALRLLEHLQTLKWVFPQKFHYCDVKGGHFGLDESGKIRLLDVDMVFVESALVKNIQASQPCMNDDDCSFIDCTGRCDSFSRKCYPHIINDNLQRVCKNVYLGSFAQHSFGLLTSPPKSIQKELNDLLEECIALRTDTEDSDKHSEKVINSLTLLFKRISSEY